jgi:vancomycin resistance protein YoaR
MFRAKTAPTEELLDLEDVPEEEVEETNAWQKAPLWARVITTTLGILVVLTASFEFVYANKIFPGVKANGVYVGGLSEKEAADQVAARQQTFTGAVVTIDNQETHLRIPVASLSATYNAQKAVDTAYDYGRRGSFGQRVVEQARALFGAASPVSSYMYPTDLLTPYLVDFSNDLSTPVQNAKLSFNDNHAQVTPANPGNRLDVGRLVEMVNDRLANMSTEPIAAPAYQIKPTLQTDQLKAAVSQIDNYISAPITIAYMGTEREIDQKTIISWVEVGAPVTPTFVSTLKLENLYPLPPAANLGLSHKAVAAFVAELADGIDQDAQDAQLAMVDNQLTVTQASHDGVKVDQTTAINDVTSALKLSGDARKVSLRLQTTRSEVNENNLANLGIKELLSTGETTFPGSSSARLINVRAGAKRFNDTLLKPGETFSFGKILGAVGPETGYVPELVILGDHEEKQYGGGLCQVASTAYRAALLAGLPITERHNHSFAVSFYTAPYGVPGVDATIYYPQVDLKFVNDSPGYLLIQTVMEGTDLKFFFYGTKTKSGAIRGPEFITGTTDATQPSHTVFYRDVLDLNGNVTKTDTINTYYKSSKDFPVQPQFN